MAKVIIVGAGPAGIMAALSSAKNNEVILIDRNNEIGMKLKLTGGGRCNITNNRDIEEFFDKIVNNNKFLYSALYTFSNYSLLEYFTNNGLEYKVELDEKVYTKSDKADEVYTMLSKKFMCDYDEAGSIGKRYRREDEIGTPYCVTVDFDTLEDESVTIRDRDTMEQVRVKISELEAWIAEKVEF